MIADNQGASKALNYLIETDGPAANAKALMLGLEDQKKTILAVLFNQATGSAEARRQEAMASDEYKGHIEKLNQAVLDYETLRNRRLTANLIIEVFRTEAANRRAGQIV